MSLTKTFVRVEWRHLAPLCLSLFCREPIMLLCDYDSYNEMCVLPSRHREYERAILMGSFLTYLSSSTPFNLIINLRKWATKNKSGKMSEDKKWWTIILFHFINHSRVLHIFVYATYINYKHVGQKGHKRMSFI